MEEERCRGEGRARGWVVKGDVNRGGMSAQGCMLFTKSDQRQASAFWFRVGGAVGGVVEARNHGVIKTDQGYPNLPSRHGNVQILLTLATHVAGIISDRRKQLEEEIEDLMNKDDADRGQGVKKQNGTGEEEEDGARDEGMDVSRDEGESQPAGQEDGSKETPTKCVFLFTFLRLNSNSH